MDAVFHLAAVISALDWETYYQTNTRGTENLIEACLEERPGPRKFVFVSSISAAGPSPPGLALRETDEARPVSPYGRSKLLAEEAVLARAALLPVTIVRPPNVIGPRQKELVQTIRLLERRVRPLVGTDETRTSLASVDDVVRALILAAESPKSNGEIYYVTDGGAYSWREVTAALVEGLGLRGFALPIPYPVQLGAAAASQAVARLRGTAPLLSVQHVRATRTLSWVYDGSKIERELGFSPSQDLKETVRRVVAWYRSAGPKAARV
jgi:nucleoside-diphosphate-sugar epimerase